MYLHIGLNYLIKTKYIVGIFDMENTTTSSITKRFLADAEKFGEVVSATQEIRVKQNPAPDILAKNIFASKY